MVLARLAQTELAAFTESHSWSASMTLSPAAAEALTLLVDSFPFFNGSPIRNKSTAIPLSKFIETSTTDSRVVHGVRDLNCIVASDASANAVCAYNVKGAGGLFHQLVLSSTEAGFLQSKLLCVLAYRFRKFGYISYQRIISSPYLNDSP